MVVEGMSDMHVGLGYFGPSISIHWTHSLDEPNHLIPAVRAIVSRS